MILDILLVKAKNLKQRVRIKLYHSIKPKIIRWHGLKIATGDHMSSMIADALFWQTYEEGEALIVAKFLEPDDVVFEVGTGLGAIALLCSQKIGAERVSTYEANPALEKHIRENFRLNGLHPKHQICLLAEGPGEVDFFAAPSFELSTAVRPLDSSSVTRTATRSLNQELRNVDPTFLIVDIEGGEFALFETLDDFGRITKVAIELHSHIIGEEKIASVKQRLVDAGFVIDPQHTVGMQLYAFKPPVGRLRTDFDQPAPTQKVIT